MCILWGWGARGIDIMETKKLYDEPQMEVVEMNAKSQLLAGSGGGNQGDLAPKIDELDEE